MNPTTPAPTCAACLTPPGAAAIAVVAVRGPAAWAVARDMVRLRAHPERELPPVPREGQFWLGRLTGEIADEVLLALRRRSPTPWVEFHCHGGRQVVQGLLEALAGHGVRIGSWQDLERATAADPLSATAWSALAEARTTRTAAILLDQYHGAFGRALDDILLALGRADTEGAGQQLEALLRWAPLGRHLTTPWRVVVAGAPNVGKSSLVNALAGYQRSIVSPVPGTTRDIVSTLIALDGWPIELVDTAGLHAGSEELEKAGMALARVRIAEADLCLWVHDAATGPTQPAAALPTVRRLVNKIDLPATWDWRAEPEVLPLSARTGEGLEHLGEAIASWLVPEAPAAGTAVPFTPGLGDAIAAAACCCPSGQVEQAALLLQEVRDGTRS